MGGTTTDPLSVILGRDFLALRLTMYLHEAMNRPDSSEFKMAMQKELGDQTIK